MAGSRSLGVPGTVGSSGACSSRPRVVTTSRGIRSGSARRTDRGDAGEAIASLRLLFRVLDEYAAAHPEAGRVGIGDLSRPHGGVFDERFGGRGHASHQNGLDVDVYYPRLDGRELRAGATGSGRTRPLPGPRDSVRAGGRREGLRRAAGRAFTGRGGRSSRSSTTTTTCTSASAPRSRRAGHPARASKTKWFGQPGRSGRRDGPPHLAAMAASSGQGTATAAPGTSARNTLGSISSIRSRMPAAM